MTLKCVCQRAIKEEIQSLTVFFPTRRFQLSSSSVFIFFSSLFWIFGTFSSNAYDSTWNSKCFSSTCVMLLHTRNLLAYCLNRWYSFMQTNREIKILRTLFPANGSVHCYTCVDSTRRNLLRIQTTRIQNDYQTFEWIHFVYLLFSVFFVHFLLFSILVFDIIFESIFNNWNHFHIINIYLHMKTHSNHNLFSIGIATVKFHRACFSTTKARENQNHTSIWVIFLLAHSWNPTHQTSYLHL